MKKLLERKPIILFLSAVGLAGLIYLSAGLRNIQFRPAEPLNFGLNYTDQSLSDLPLFDSKLWFFLVCFGVVLMVLTVAVGMLDPKFRKQVTKGMIRVLLAMAIIAWLMKDRLKNDGKLQMPQLPSSISAASSPGQGAPGLGYTPPVVSPWLVFGMSFIVAAILIVAAWLVYRRWKNQKTSAPLEQIAGIARQAIEGLADGRNWDDAIVQCYVRMNQVVTAERGLIRQIGTTPSEFATRMERNGLPGEAVRTLTQLFEQVRYGKITPSANDRNLAVAALNAILRACGETP